MYRMGRRGYASRRRFGWPGSPLVVVALVLGGVFLLSVAGPVFHFFPFFVLFFLMFFVVGPAIRASARGRLEVSERREQEPVEEGQKERQLLQALERCGELSPARAALETTLSVSEADRILSGLAKDGHVEVRAREGRLGYALWDRDRDTNRKELEDES